jgi:hypothetical protein
VRGLLVFIVAGQLSLFAPDRAGAADAPVGSAHLRTLTARDPPFGHLIRDTFPFEGVRIQRLRRDDAPVDWLLVWIDLRTPGLGYRVSPIHYRADPTGTPTQAAYTQTTVDFLRHSGDPPIALAVNTVAYTPFPVADGMPVFLCDPVWQGEDTATDPAPGKLMIGLRSGGAVIGDAGTVRTARPQVALASFFWEESVLVRRGEIVRKGGVPHARTAVGTDAEGRVLFLLVADGYNPGVSEGLTSGEVAQLLHATGAHDALLLDGGGSSTLVGRGPDGDAVVVNRPAGLQRRPGTLRYVAVNLGFTGLRPSADPLPALPDWQAPLHIRVWEEMLLQFRVRPVRSTLFVVPVVLLLGVIAVRLWRRYRNRARARRAANPGTVPGNSGADSGFRVQAPNSE